jgi:hypothetical protein
MYYQPKWGKWIIGMLQFNLTNLFLRWHEKAHEKTHMLVNCGWIIGDDTQGFLK